MKNFRLSLFISFFAFFGILCARAAGWPANYGGVMLQGFYWDSYDDTKWTNLESQADDLAGYFDIIWVPNSGQSSGSPSMGYLPIYWFSNHNSSFGSDAQIRSLISTLHNKGVNVIMDLVLNHRAGATNWADFPSETWRGTTYHLGSQHICCTDEWARNGGNPTGANDTGDDFDGGRDLDHTNTTVQNNCKDYCKFLLDDMGYAGFRLDMVKGYSGYYNKIYNQYSKPRFCVGEYWDGYDNIAAWIESTDKESAAFDFPFKYALNDAMNNNSYNMAALTWLAGSNPQPAGMIHNGYQQYAVTFIDNHDTYRNQNKFTGNVVAANAFMLCSPGTPCVFLPHWKQYKNEIKQLIAIRKACGVTNTSRVNVLRNSSTCYMAQVLGNKGNLIVKIGTSMDDIPSEYSGYSIKAYGTNWCVWTNVDVDATPGPVDSGSFKVYYDNSASRWTTPKVHYFGGTQSSTWPGVNMTKVDGTDNIFEYTVASGTTGIVFNNGSGSQTDDLNASPLHLYNTTGDRGLYNPDSSGGSGSDTPAVGNVIYFDNKGPNWSTPYIHYWGGSSESTWPGTPMERVNGSMFKYEVAPGTKQILFNAGNGDATKTADFTAVMGHDYTQSGDQGLHVPNQLYVLGQIDGYNWSTSNGCRLTRSGNSFVGQISVDNISNGGGTFSLVTQTGSNWTAVNNAHRYGSSTSNEPLAPGTPKVIVKYGLGNNPAGAQSWQSPAGIYIVKANFDNMTISIRQNTISLNKSVLALGSDESADLVAIIDPGEIEEISLVWSSSNPAVATVSTSGKVTAVGKGSATITATYGKISATCTVYVGKKQQSILWTQTIENVPKNQTVNLTASATSSLPVSYEITNGSSFAQLTDGNKLTAVAPGLVTVKAQQSGNDNYAPAEPVSKTFRITLDYVEGDINGDNTIDISDASAIVLHILGETPANFNAEAADVDGDGTITVVDVTRVVAIVLDNTPVRELPRHIRIRSVDNLGSH